MGALASLLHGIAAPCRQALVKPRETACESGGEDAGRAHRHLAQRPGGGRKDGVGDDLVRIGYRHGKLPVTQVAAMFVNARCADHARLHQRQRNRLAPGQHL